MDYETSSDSPAYRTATQIFSKGKTEDDVNSENTNFK